jgi:hypothetical protein
MTPDVTTKSGGMWKSQLCATDITGSELTPEAREEGDFFVVLSGWKNKDTFGTIPKVFCSRNY